MYTTLQVYLGVPTSWVGLGLGSTCRVIENDTRCRPKWRLDWIELIVGCGESSFS